MVLIELEAKKQGLKAGRDADANARIWLEKVRLNITEFLQKNLRLEQERNQTLLEIIGALRKCLERYC